MSQINAVEAPIINSPYDEPAHHWPIESFAIDDETAEIDAREATVWVEGLDRINKALGGRANRGNGIRLCMDLSPRRSSSRAAATRWASASREWCLTSVCWSPSRPGW